MRRHKTWLAAVAVVVLIGGIVVGIVVSRSGPEASSEASSAGIGPQPTGYHVPGENYQICEQQSKYLTSPWTYDALKSGSQSYTVARYEALPGYGRTLPPLPSYIASESPGTEAAVIYAPGSKVQSPPYNFPNSPIIQFFEGGAYSGLALESVSGDEFIGGSAPGYPEPVFDDGGAAGGINADNDSYGYSGAESTLAAEATAGATRITIKTAIPGYIDYETFADGST